MESNSLKLSRLRKELIYAEWASDIAREDALRREIARWASDIAREDALRREIARWASDIAREEPCAVKSPDWN